MSNKRITVYRPRNLKDGIVTKVIAGEKMRITDRERSVVESFKYFDDETALKTLEYYLNQDKKKIKLDKLFAIAKKLKSVKIINIMKNITVAHANNYPQLNETTYNQSVEWFSKTGN